MYFDPTVLQALWGQSPAQSGADASRSLPRRATSQSWRVGSSQPLRQWRAQPVREALRIANALAGRPHGPLAGRLLGGARGPVAAEVAAHNPSASFVTPRPLGLPCLRQPLHPVSQIDESQIARARLSLAGCICRSVSRDPVYGNRSTRRRSLPAAASAQHAITDAPGPAKTVIAPAAGTGTQSSPQGRTAGGGASPKAPET